MFERIVIYLILKTVTWTASTSASWITALDNKIIYDSMKRNSIVKALSG